MPSERPNDSHEAGDDTTEATPLLVDQPAKPVDEQSSTETPKDDAGRPLPKAQLTYLCIARAIDPIAAFAIFPFVPQMVRRNGNLDYGEVGFYTGLIESAYSLSQMFVMLSWGQLSDRYGRKPVLAICLFATAVTMTVFGASKTIWQMILFRCFCGLFGGIPVTLRTMFAEVSTAKTQATAFSWFAFSGNLGIFIGPLAGGALAEPATQYPGVFGGVQFFEDYPFLLATLFIGGVGMVAFLLVILLVKETFPVQQRKRPGTGDAETDQPMSVWALLKDRKITTCVFLYCYTMAMAFANTAMFPTFLFTPIDLGGFGFEERYISLSLGLIGLSQALWLILVFPRLQRRHGTGFVLRLCSYIWPVFFALNPIYNALLRSGIPAVTTFVWVAYPITLAVGTGVAMSFTACQLCLNDIAPSSRVMGTLNGLALTISSGLRAFMPAAANSLFAVGVQHQIMNGQLGWVMMIVLSLINIAVVRFLPEEAEGKIKD